MFFIRSLWRVVWSDVTLCSLLVERCVLRACCLHLQGWTKKKLTVVTVSLCLIFEPEYGDKTFFRNVHNLIFYFILCHIWDDSLVANDIPCRIDIFICNFFYSGNYKDYYCVDVKMCSFVDGKENFGGIPLNLEAVVFFLIRLAIVIVK